MVPRRYPRLSGRNTVPNCHFSGWMVLISQMGRHGSSIAIAVVDTYTWVRRSRTKIFQKIIIT